MSLKPSIFYIGNQMIGADGYNVIAQEDLLTTNWTNMIEAEHGLASTTFDALDNGGFAIWGERSEDDLAGGTAATLQAYNSANQPVGTVVNLDATRFVIVFTAAELADMGQGSELIKVTASRSGETTISSTIFVTVDTFEPQVNLTTPIDASEDFGVANDITLTFSENVSAVTGGQIRIDLGSDTDDVAEEATVTFTELAAGESITVGGLTYTANGNYNSNTLTYAPVSAETVAADFLAFINANKDAGNPGGYIMGFGGGTALDPYFGTSQGNFSGGISGWTIAAGAETDQLDFTSSVQDTVTDLAVIDDSGAHAMSVRVVQGSASVTEKVHFNFVALAATETVTINGETFTAPVGGATAVEVATAFATSTGLTGAVADANFTSGPVLAGVGSGATLTYTSTTTLTNVTDLTYSGGSAAAQDSVIDTTTQGSSDDIVIDVTGVDPDGTVTVNGKTVTIDLDDDLAYNSQYTVTVVEGSFEDAAGNSNDEHQFSFNTEHTVSNIFVATMLDNAGHAVEAETFTGAAVFGTLGNSVSNAGDYNGDGYEDFIIGARGQDTSFVVFGGKDGISSSFTSLAALNGKNGGFKITGGSTGNDLGASVSSAGDVNGDGLGDLLIGSTTAFGASKGAAHIIYGKKSGIGNIDTSTLNGTKGVNITDAATSGTVKAFGYSVSSIGDFNGDGLDDVIVGNPGSVAVGEDAGKSYILFGQKNGFDLDDNGSKDTSIDIRNLSNAKASVEDGFTFDHSAAGGAAGANSSGIAVSGAGDINGDGFADLMIGMPADSAGFSSNGKVYVMFGGDAAAMGDFVTSDTDLGTGLGGMTLSGGGFDLSGVSVSGAGDVNGDGMDDMVVGNWGGSAYVVFGDENLGAGDDIDLSAMTTEGFKITDGFAGMFSLGLSVSGAGDINGDGFDDIIVGEYGSASAVPYGADVDGAAYVIFGKASGFGNIDLSTPLDGSNGFKITGTDGSSDHIGQAVSAAGDLNGDGYDDLMVGAGQANSLSGEAYIIYGSEHYGHQVDYAGTANKDILTGTSAAETFVGGRGNDILNGKGGADSFIGGQGNDIIKVSSLTFRSVDGGTGSDTLAFNMRNANIDLSETGDDLNDVIRGIETLDIKGTGNNTLTIDDSFVLQASDESNKLIVTGNAGDTVEIGGDFTYVGLIGAYDRYESGNAQLWLAHSSNLTVELI